MSPISCLNFFGDLPTFPVLYASLLRRSIKTILWKKCLKRPFTAHIIPEQSFLTCKTSPVRRLSHLTWESRLYRVSHKNTPKNLKPNTAVQHLPLICLGLRSRYLLGLCNVVSTTKLKVQCKYTAIY